MSGAARNALAVLWPSFVIAGGAEFLFFAVFDPHELAFLGRPLEASRQAVYTIGFFGFWAVGAASAALALWLRRDAT